MAPVFRIILLKKIHTSIKLLSIIVTFSVFIFNFKASAKLSGEERRGNNGSGAVGKNIAYQPPTSTSLSVFLRNQSDILIIIAVVVVQCHPPPFNSLMSLKIKFNFRKKEQNAKKIRSMLWLRGEKNISSFFWRYQPCSIGCQLFFLHFLLKLLSPTNPTKLLNFIVNGFHWI